MYCSFPQSPRPSYVDRSSLSLDPLPRTHPYSCASSFIPSLKDKTARQEVYDALVAVMYHRDVGAARSACQELVDSLVAHANTRPFGQYLSTHWLGCVEKWALGSRTADGISTNMHMEAFHRVLKYLYLNGRVSKRVDK